MTDFKEICFKPVRIRFGTNLLCYGSSSVWVLLYSYGSRSQQINRGMIDLIGSPITINDYVAVVRGAGRTYLVIGKVVKLTPKGARVDMPDGSNKFCMSNQMIYVPATNATLYALKHSA